MDMSVLTNCASVMSAVQRSAAVVYWKDVVHEVEHPFMQASLPFGPGAAAVAET